MTLDCNQGNGRIVVTVNQQAGYSTRSCAYPAPHGPTTLVQEMSFYLPHYHGGAGLSAALQTVWFDAAQQRCLFHKLRIIARAIRLPAVVWSASTLLSVVVPALPMPAILVRV